MNESPLTIIGLKVQDVMGVRAVEIRPDPSGIVVVGGDNGAGKTSLISSIWFALGGKPNVPEPIRIGEPSAEVQLDLGDLVVTRRWRRTDDGKITSDLRVSNREGAEYRSPQGVLDALVTKFGFDPFDFTRLKPKDQVERLKSALGIDTDAIERERKAAYDERTLVNRDLARLSAQHSGQQVPLDTPDEEIDVTALVQQLDHAHRHTESISESENLRKTMHERLAEMDAVIAAIEKDLAEKKQKRDDYAVKLGALAPVGSRVDTESLSRQIEQAQTINAAVRAKRAAAAARDEWNALEAKRIELSNAIEQYSIRERELVADAFAKANISDGLTYDEDGLYVGGVPFVQCNTAVQVQIAVALAVHENPRLRVFRIADGEKLTPKSLDAVAQIAKAHGAQIWVEQALTAEDVAGGFREVTVLIEDGRAVDVEVAR